MKRVLPGFAAMAVVLGLGCAAVERGTAEVRQAAEDVAEGPSPRQYDTLVEQVGDMRLEYSYGDGVRLGVFGIPVLHTSLLVSTTPGWGDQYYLSTNNTRIMERVTAEDYRDGRRITIHHRMAGDHHSPFAGTKTITLLPDNSYHQKLDFRFDSEEPSIFEWRVGGFNPNLVAGVPYRAVEEERTHSGTIPYEAPGPGVEESTVSRQFSELFIESRIGDIVIESDPADDLMLFDYRKNVYAEDTNPMFWFGYLERPLPAFEDMSYEFTLRLPEAYTPAGQTIGTVAASAVAEETDTARVPNRQRDYIIPKPKELEFTEEEIPLGRDTVIYTGDNPGAGIETAVEFLLRDLREIYEIEAEVVRGPAPDPPPAGAIVLGETGRYGVPAELLAGHGLEIPDHEEGYALRTGDGYAAIAADTEVGVFFGVTSLVQLVGIGTDGVVLRGAEVVDWPSLDFRGIHALSGKNAGGQISKAVRELMARYKINSFIWECQYIIWDNAPEIEHPVFGMEKDDAQKVIDAADKYFINLIPLVQSLGHSEWIFTNNQNLDIAEDPETPYAYMVTNPRTYEFIFTIYQEALDFFEPEGFHIGHDEVTMRGRFPYRSADSGMSVTELIMKDTIKLNDWFRERGVDVYLWGDMFLHSSEAPDATFARTPEEAQERRDLLPGDMIVTDWHYVPVEPEAYTSIPLWRDEGFRTIGAAWFNPTNIRNLALACIENGVAGFLQTTWAGFNFSIDGNEAAWYQYWAYITAAHYAWSGDETLPHDLPFVPKDEFIDTWFRAKPLLEERAGFHLDLREAFNRSLADPDGSGWLGYGPDHDFSTLPEGDLLLDETTFRLARTDDGLGAVMLTGNMNPGGVYPEEIVLTTEGVTASELRLLMTSSFATREGAEVGSLVVDFADGTSEVMPLEYGRSIFSFGANRAGDAARIAWEGETASGSAIRLWDVVWSNPHPDKKITGLRLSSTGTEAAPILFAVTGVH